MATRAKATRGDRARRSRRGRREDRPYVVVLFGLLVVIGAMALGPLRSLAAANERVDQLAEERDLLAEEVEKLEDKKAGLNDPAEQEVYAREQLGFVRPGEVPYVVLPGEKGAVAEEEDAQSAGEAGGQPSPWYRRLADAVTSVFGG